ncbi:hypothetical protein CKAN_01959000 [Cinnamomum micranthum f. kanehirae]|uniref:Nucleoporin protein Ndc1-Nup n=1 Tax=Cinnamomum micranthum f. kanehirae TaxID=337451 RepID=A0A3S4PHC5_9MAGN|nr:hypothetical protein CKAN_01959000 [Cinnamomum micranthum f. kanehirae]
MSPEIVVKNRWLGFLIWQSISSTSLFFLHKTLILSLFSSSKNPSFLLSIFFFVSFHLSLLLLSLSLFLLSSPQPDPAASAPDLARGLLRLLLKSVVARSSADLSTADFRRRAAKSLSFLTFVILSGISGFLSVVSVCDGDGLLDATRFFRLGLRGIVLGILFGVDYVCRKRWVLVFPIIQRPLFFSFKMGLPSSLRQALKLSSAAYLISTVLMLFLPDPFQLKSTIRQLLVQQITIYLGTSVVSFCWELSHHLLQVLLTRRFIFAPPQGSAAAETNPSEPLLAALEQSTPRSIFQYLAYLDLCMVCENNVDTWRRAAFFEETGETYRRVVSACLRPLEQLTSRIAEGLEGSSAEKSDLFSQQLSSPMVTHVDLRLHEAFNDFQLCAWSARTVASLTARSRGEDRFGVAQLTGCNAAVVSTLLSCLLAVEACLGKKTSPQSPHLLSPTNIRWATVNTGRREFVGKKRDNTLHGKAYVMADVLRTSIYEIVSPFHEEMQKCAKAAILDKDWIIKSKALYSTREILVHKLSLFLDFRAN